MFVVTALLLAKVDVYWWMGRLSKSDHMWCARCFGESLLMMHDTTASLTCRTNSIRIFAGVLNLHPKLEGWMIGVHKWPPCLTLHHSCGLGFQTFSCSVYRWHYIRDLWLVLDIVRTTLIASGTLSVQYFGDTWRIFESSRGTSYLQSH